MDITTLRIVTTLVSFAVFVGILVWAFARRNKAAFERAGQIPFTQDEA